MVIVITAPGRSLRQLDWLLGVTMGTSMASATTKTRWARGIAGTGIAACGTDETVSAVEAWATATGPDVQTKSPQAVTAEARAARHAARVDIDAFPFRYPGIDVATMFWFGAGWVRRSYSLDERPIGPVDQCFPLVSHCKAGHEPQAQEWVKPKRTMPAAEAGMVRLVTSYVRGEVSGAMPSSACRT